MWLLGVEVMVYAVAVISAVAEVEGLLGGGRGKDTVKMGRVNETVETAREKRDKTV